MEPLSNEQIHQLLIQHQDERGQRFDFFPQPDIFALATWLLTAGQDAELRSVLRRLLHSYGANVDVWTLPTRLSYQRPGRAWALELLQAAYDDLRVLMGRCGHIYTTDLSANATYRPDADTEQPSAEEWLAGAHNDLGRFTLALVEQERFLREAIDSRSKQLDGPAWEELRQREPQSHLGSQPALDLPDTGWEAFWNSLPRKWPDVFRAPPSPEQLADYLLARARLVLAPASSTTQEPPPPQRTWNELIDRRFYRHPEGLPEEFDEAAYRDFFENLVRGVYEASSDVSQTEATA